MFLFLKFGNEFNPYIYLFIYYYFDNMWERKIVSLTSLIVTTLLIKKDVKHCKKLRRIMLNV